jgi:hypothetical protein
MKGNLEYAFAAGELIVRTARHLVVLTLPLVCWLAGQECPAQALLVWAVRRGAALLATPRSAAGAREGLGVSSLREDARAEINGIQAIQGLNEIVKTGIPGFIPKGA